MKSLVMKEVTVGFLNGLLWAVLTSTFAWWWFNDALLGIVFGAAILVNLVSGALAGALIPIILDRFKIDPALASGLMLTTVTDTMGFFALLGLATIILLRGAGAG
jgi:magnesium transporter